MAKTFYKYQERDIDSQVNWADIGLGMSDMITDQVAVRKAKKEAYDDEVRAFNQYLDEAPKGDDENLASWTSAYSSDMQKKMLENQRAFKNGMISERDNVTFTQNVKNGTNTIFNLATEYQAEYKETMARMNSTDPLNRNQELEMFIKAQNESYDNYKTSKPIIDPKTGLVLMSMKKADGTYETVSAANLSNRIKAKYDYFDSNGTTTLIESELGEEIISTYEEAKSRLKTGVITEEEFKPLKAGFDNALKKRIGSYLVSPTNVSSVLTNDLLFDAQGNSVDYSFTYDKTEAEADPLKILLVVKGGGDGMPMPDFTTENGKRQIEAAQEYMTVQTIEKIDRKVSKQVVGALGDVSDYQLSIGEDKKVLIQKGKDAGEQLAILLTSKNKNLVQNAGASLSQLYAGISNLDKKGKNMNIGFGGKSNDFEGAYVTPYQYAKGVLNSLGLTPVEQKQALITFQQKAGTELNSYDATGVTPPPADIETGKYDKEGVFSSGNLFQQK
jgi:hypothetical protein